MLRKTLTTLMKKNSHYCNKVRISLKEMRESNFWLKVIRGINTNEKLNEEIDNLVKESHELKNILGSICVKTNRKK